MVCPETRAARRDGQLCTTRVSNQAWRRRIRRPRVQWRFVPGPIARDAVIDESARPPVNSPPEGEAALITPYRDGPLVVRGPFRLIDQEGVEIEVRRKTIALCRCGKSRMRPFCDGSHKLIRFSAPSGAEEGREGAATRPPAR